MIVVHVTCTIPSSMVLVVHGTKYNSTSLLTVKGLIEYKTSSDNMALDAAKLSSISGSNLRIFRWPILILILGIFATITARGVIPREFEVDVRQVSRQNSNSTSYKPIIIIHGILAKSSTMDSLKNMILQAHPGTKVTIVPLFDDLKSLESLWTQVPKFAEAMRPIMQQAKNGVILMCYSQGGIICRGILETVPDHNVHTFIALSTPQMGQYGDTSYIIPFIPKIKEEVYKFCYLNPFGQDVSICNYWNDPHEQALYRKYNKFLPVINNETANAKSKEWKANFLRLKQLVLIGGPDDGVITPWQSSHFGFYDTSEKIVEMKEQEVYKEDYFGLKTLDQQQALKTYAIPGVQHLKWHRNQTVFDCCIEPWLI